MAIENRSPAEGTAGGQRAEAILAAGWLLDVDSTRRAVYCQVAGLHEQLLRSAAAAERATSTAAWHYERAARYLPWVDLPWARQRYEFHIAQAAYQDALAARHAAIREALEGMAQP
jgi:hypothetical protein